MSSQNQTQNSVASNKRIAENTLYLYIRMFVTMTIMLYMSRAIIAALGIVDFGIWNVVAGIIAMFSFLNASMTGATSRFLTYELVNKDTSKLQKVFSSALTIHMIIAVAVLILGETIGLWFLQNKLVIPQDRMFAANVLFQISLVNTIVNIVQVPYNAMIMANERMNIYAYIEMSNVIMKFIAVLLLAIIPTDKLISIGILMMLVSLTTILAYRYYCTRYLSGCNFKIYKDKQIIKPMLAFSGWDLYGNASVIARTQGVNMLLNIFFSVTMNAASGIATQVQAAVMSFAGSVLQAFKPQIIKSFAIKEYDRMISLIFKASSYTTMLLLLFTIPLCIEMNYVLSLWLGDVPPYASILCIYTLIFNVFANLSSCILSGIHATGKIKRPSIINGTFYLLVIPFSYIAYKNGGDAELAFIFNIIAVGLGLLSNVYTINKHVRIFKVSRYLSQVIVKCFIIALCSVIVCLFIIKSYEESFLRLFLVCVVNGVIIVISTFFLIMDCNERKLIKNKIKALVWKKA